MTGIYTLGIRKIYENNGRWTWNTDPDRIPSGDHKFIEIVEGGAINQIF